MKLLDPIGATFSLLSTYFFTQAKTIAWPLALIAEGVDLILFYKTGIYGDMSLEVIYILLTLYGWYLWFSKTKQEELPITSLQKQDIAIQLLIAITAIPLLSIFLKFVVHSTVPYLDAITTIISLQAQWLLCQKKIENWILWFLVDALYIGLYLDKSIPFHGVINILYLGLAVVGLLRWLKIRRYLL